MEAFQQTVANMSQRSHSDPLKNSTGISFISRVFCQCKICFFKTLSQTVAHSLPAVSTQPGDSECTTLSCIPHLHSRMECSTYVVPRDWGSDFGTTY